MGATAGLGLLLGTATGAQAQMLYGLGTLTAAFGNQPAGAQAIIPITAGNGQPTLSFAFITGITAGQRLVGFDYRPNTGEAFVLGYDASAAAPATNAQLYTVVPTTGALTAVGAAMRLELGGSGERIGFDFNPTVDRIRVVSTNDANYRLNPTTGAVTTDLNLNYLSGSPANPNVGAVAYTNSYRASSNTVLYDFDEVAGILSTQSPPNDGVLIAQKSVLFGSNPVGSPVAIDMDISSYTTPGTEEAFVMEVTQANGSGFSSSNLYSIDLATGQATLRGNTIPASATTPFNVEDIAVSIPAPAALTAITGQLVYGITASNNLITFDSQNPGVVRTIVGISGLPATQTLVGTDFRPNTGELFGLGYNPAATGTTANSQVYRIDLATGAATAVGAAIRLELGGSSEQIAFDFNPTVDRIRVEGTNDNNYRLNPVTGGIAAVDGTLKYGTNDPGAGQNPSVGTGAYGNSFVGSTTTGLYTVDHALGYFSFQNPPNDGTLINSRVLTGVNGPGVSGAIGAINDLDIYYNGTTNVPYLVAAAAATPNTSRFFQLTDISMTSTATQVATDLGQIGALPVSVRDISIPLSTASVVAANPGAVTGQLLYAIAGGNLISFDSGNPGVIRSAVNFGGGITTGQTVVGTDFRPATGQLFALGYDPSTTGTNAQLYTVSLTTGALTAVGTAIRLELGTGATAGTLPQVGFDFNPTVDRIRVISANSGTGISNNYRLNPNNGAIAATDTNLNGQAGTYSATAYTNNQSNANTTAQFVFDSNTGNITQVTNPNGGVVSGTSYSVTGASTTSGGDFDIYNTPGTSTNQGFIATAASSASANDNLYVIGDFGSPFTFSVTNAGRIGQGSNVSGLAAFIAAGTGLTWNGSASTDWGTAANWTPAQVPAANSDVTIPGGTPNQPTVSSAQQARLVTLGTGAVLTLANNGTLTTGGSFTNNGGSVAGGATSTGTLVLGGTAPVIGGTSLSTFPNLTANSVASTTGPVAVQRALTLNNNLTIGSGVGFTLLSSASGTAYVVNNGSAVLSGTATVQRSIDGSLNSGPGYRHYSAPVSNSTVADLATSGFAPTLTQSYNSAADPTLVTPFPTVFGYDQSLVNRTNASGNFDKGFFVPASGSTALTPGRGYAVNLDASQLVDFVGTLNNGDISVPVARNAAGTLNAADAGWQLLGNPYPAPLDYSLVQAADRTGLENAIYTYSSTGQYVGQYRAYNNGVGNPIVPVGQGFFTRVAAAGASGTLTFRNGQRLTTSDPTTFQRPTADPRPLVQLELRGSTGPADAFFAYAEAGATAAYETQYDAAKLPNPNGLNLAGAATSGEAVAIDGRPAFTAATVLPLTVSVPAAGTYALSAAALANLPTGLDAYLADDQTGQTLKLSAGTSYSFGATAAQAAAPIAGRFRLYFRPNAPLATVPSLTSEVVGVYPNPAHGRFTVALPGLAQATTVQAELLNGLGQVVRRQQVALPATGTQFGLEVADMATGVYTLRLQVGATTLAKRVVIQ
ncbi:MAG TPA: DUF4394 domain-containing protein [Hymenobacter sp.]|uniref:DUF4394 domain-containing protein n=1 Tax=Hymenobacter sp. TaxID=1898978 RepID=UPI002D80EBF7|nr:DUF4394 domain-containing protein [Hymenobacter sp.]HET9503534.1 DUF4394 domain-containing protein [Hymenobacter sp.]